MPGMDGYTVRSLCQGQEGTGTRIAVPEGETATVSLLNEYTPDLVKLTVTKKVNGNMGDPSQKFAFTLEVNGETKTFTLKDGEKAAFEFPRGSVYTITESKASRVHHNHQWKGFGGTEPFRRRFKVIRPWST